jgi:DNA-binding CsgD family transcriptional regulator
MKNYTDSDYALNKYSEGIVYRFADGIVEVTLADYLAENPGKTEADFRALKELSDADYFERDRAENAKTKRNLNYADVDETELCQSPSPEDLHIGNLLACEEAEQHTQRVELAHKALASLTDVQRRRYLLYHVDGLSSWQIAAVEGSNQKTVYESLQAAEKKIKKFLTKV